MSTPNNYDEYPCITSELKTIKNDGVIKFYENFDFIITISKENYLKKYIVFTGDDGHGSALSQEETPVPFSDYLKSQIQFEIIENSFFDVEEFCKNHDKLEFLKFELAQLLENGLCAIFDKKALKYVETIRIETYSNIYDFLAGEGGRRFFVNDILILTVKDWVS